MEDLGPELSLALRGRVVSAQRAARAPGVVAVVSQGDRRLAEISVGMADLESGLEASPEVQFRCGSITKTVTAVGIMQQVAAGRLDLGQSLADVWPGAPHGELRIVDLLSHTSGLQREPVGEVWETLAPPSAEELPANAAAARRVLPRGRWWHYSNLGFALLGEVLARVTSRSWEEYVEEKILGPLQMTRTSWHPSAPHAVGYLVDPYSQRAYPEPLVDSGGIGPAAQLWSTASDLSRWAAFLGAGADPVLSRADLDAMRQPRVLADLDGWALGWGLGLMLVRRGERVFSGHTGSMPGFVAAAFASPAAGTSVVVVGNSTAGLAPARLAADLLELVPSDPGASWRPESPPPAEIAQLLGRWWSEGSEWIFSWSEEQLRSRPAGEPGAPAERYRQLGPDRFVAETGPERGEELRVVRDPAGRAVKLYRATYPFTRDPRTFGSGGPGPEATLPRG